MQFEEYLRQQGVAHERHDHAKTYTAQELAHEEHVSGYMVAKPVVVIGPNGPAMCVLPAPTKVDLQRAADALGESTVRLAIESEMVDLFPDCELGAEPPMGPLFNMQTVMDPHLREDEFLVMQAGAHDRAVRLRREDWERVCRPIVAPIICTKLIAD